jgi:predicted Zn-dependent protease
MARRLAKASSLAFSRLSEFKQPALSFTMPVRVLDEKPAANNRGRQTFAIAVLVCACMAAPVWPVSAPVDATSTAAMEREFQSALAAQDKGDLDRAEALLRDLHIHHPGIFQVDETLGLLLVSRGKVAAALPMLQSAVRQQPASDVAHANLGAAYYQLHRDQLALDEFERAVQINPESVSAQESLGRVSIENQKSGQAAKAFLAALRLKPDDPDLKLDCITALLTANHLDDAQRMLSTVVDSDQSARAQSLLGEADERAGRFQEAGEHFARAVALEPNEENAWQLAVELLRHWTFDAARAEFQAASAKFPESKRLRLGLGAALYGDAKYAQAVPVFVDLLQSDPDSAMYAELLGISCNAPLATNTPRCSMLVSYAQAHPADARAATYAAGFLLTKSDNQQNIDLARQLLVHAVTANPKLPEAQFQMAVVLQQSDDWNGSIAYLERAIRLKPDYAQAHYRLARAYSRVGRRQDGQAQIELQRKYARQEQDDLNRRLSQIATFGVEVQQ